MLPFRTFPPIHRLGRIDSKNLSRVRAVTWLEKAVSHIGHTLEIVIVVTVQFQSLCATQPSGMHFMRRSCFCACQKVGAFHDVSRPTSALERFVCLFLGLFFVFFDCPRAGHRLRQRRKNFRHTSEKPSSSLHATRAEILSASCRHLETALPMEWHRLSASHGSSCKGVCPDASVRKLPPKFAGGTDRLFVFALSTFGPSPAQASDFELHYNWHKSELSMQHFDQDLLLVRSPSQVLLVIARSRLILACFQREELILFEASILSRKVAQA